MRTFRLFRRWHPGPSWAKGIALGTCLTALATRGSAEVVRLEELEANAVHRRASMDAAAHRTASARADARLSRSAYFPAVALGVEGSGSPGGRLVDVTDTNGDKYLVSGSRRLGESGAFVPQVRYGAMLSLGGQLYDFGRTRAAVEAAEAHGSAVRAEERATRASVVREVRAAYLGWLEAVALHAASQKAVASARVRRDLVQARIETGVRPPSELGPVLYEEALALLGEKATSGQLTGARLDLERAAATPLDTAAVPDGSILEREAPRGRAHEAPSRVALEKRGAAAQAMVRVHEHGRAPVLSAGAEGGVRGQATDVFPMYRAFVSLSVPLWDGGAADSRATAARAEAAALQAEAREHRATLASAEKRAEIDLADAAERVRLAESLVSFATTRVRDAEARYEIGNEKIESVLEASAGLLRAERELILAKVFRAASALQLESPR